jgi:hypothetical protein
MCACGECVNRELLERAWNTEGFPQGAVFVRLQDVEWSKQEVPCAARSKR